MPLPPAAAVASRLGTLLPEAPLDALRAGAVAVAGGKVVGAALAWQDNAELTRAQQLEAAWRGRGVEEALSEALARQL